MESKKKFSKKGCLIIVVILGVLIWGLTRDGDNKNDEIVTTEDILQGDLSPWDGSLAPLVDFVKESMKDPESFEHDKTLYLQSTKDSNEFVITMNYTGTNSFNAKVKSSVKCLYNVNTKEISNVITD